MKKDPIVLVDVSDDGLLLLPEEGMAIITPPIEEKSPVSKTPKKIKEKLFRRSVRLRKKSFKIRRR